MAFVSTSWDPSTRVYARGCIPEAQRLSLIKAKQDHQLLLTAKMVFLPPSGQRATSTVPTLFRILLLYLEPLFAFGGVILVLTQPQKYASTMTRASVTSLDPATQFIYTELGGAWLHFAFTEAIALRLLDDVRAWKVLCMAMLMSDLPYCHSVAQAVGGWQAWLVVTDWTVEDWIATATTWPFVLTRFAILFDVGLQAAKKKDG